MPLFTTAREKRLWLWALAVFAAIFSTLFLGGPLTTLWGNQNIQGAIFFLGMLLVGAAVLVYGLRKKPNRVEVAIWLGIIAVYTMFLLRLGLAERSHLIEYSVLAILVHLALMERMRWEDKALIPALLAFGITFLLGVVDESIQILLPDRVFDPVDILFNGLAALMAIGSGLILQWIRKKIQKS